MLHSDNGILFSAKKKWAIRPWKDMRNLECILLIEKGQSGKASCYVNPTMSHSRKGKTMKMIETSVILGDERWIGGAQDF